MEVRARNQSSQDEAANMQQQQQQQQTEGGSPEAQSVGGVTVKEAQGTWK